MTLLPLQQKGILPEDGHMNTPQTYAHTLLTGLPLLYSFHSLSMSQAYLELAEGAEQ